MATNSDIMEQYVTQWENGKGFKAYQPDAVRRSVVDSPGVSEARSPIAPLLVTIATAADEITAWGTNIRGRDKELRSFWPTEPMLSSAIYGMATRVAVLDWEIVSADPRKPKPRNTTAAVERMLRNSDRGKGWQTFITKLMIDCYCLAGRTRIALGGDRRGQTKSIAQIVKDEDVGPVLAVDDRGKVVERPITEWHKTPLGDRKWYWLSAENASGHSGDQRGGIYLTSDHPMLTDRGWVQAENIRPTDKIATKDPAPSEDQMRVLVGAILGDMGMARLPKRSLLRFSHSHEQEKYLDFKLGLLAGFEWTGRSVYKTKSSTFIGINSKASLGLNSLREAWYEDKKVVNREQVVRYLSAETLAIWYMDDGSLQHNSENHYAGILCTDNFSIEDVEWLIKLLTSRGIECVLQMVRGYPRIRFSAPGFRALVGLIGKYVIPSMRHKLPPDADPFDESVWQVEPANVHFDDIHAIEQRDYRSGRGVCQTTYHIGVDEYHNFIAGGLVSHNTQDNGAFIEVIRTRDDPGAAVVNLAHLDAWRCMRTGDPKVPVIYEDRWGRYHELKWYQVVTLEDMPSPIEEMYGAQLCAVSRALRAAQIIRDVAIYKNEKVSGQFARAIHFVSGVTPENIEDALALAAENQLNQGLLRYQQPHIFPTIDPGHKPEKVTLELASLPDHFDEDTTLKWYVAQLALSFGVDYQEFAPLPSGNLGSGKQSEILHLKTRGKGPAALINRLEHLFNDHRLVPANVKFRYKAIDTRADQDIATARYLRGRDRAIRMKAGELSQEAAVQLAVQDGDLPEHLAEAILANPPTIQAQNPDPLSTDNVEGGMDSRRDKAADDDVRANVLRRLQRRGEVALPDEEIELTREDILLERARIFGMEDEDDDGLSD